MSVLTWRVLDKHSYHPVHFKLTPESETEPQRDLQMCVCASELREAIEESWWS